MLLEEMISRGVVKLTVSLSSYGQAVGALERGLRGLGEDPIVIPCRKSSGRAAGAMASRSIVASNYFKTDGEPGE